MIKDIEQNLAFLKHASELIHYIATENKANTFKANGQPLKAIQRLTQIQLDTIKQTRYLITPSVDTLKQTKIESTNGKNI